MFSFWHFTENLLTAGLDLKNNPEMPFAGPWALPTLRSWEILPHLLSASQPFNDQNPRGGVSPKVEF